MSFRCGWCHTPQSAGVKPELRILKKRVFKALVGNKSIDIGSEIIDQRPLCKECLGREELWAPKEVVVFRPTPPGKGGYGSRKYLHAISPESLFHRPRKSRMKRHTPFKRTRYLFRIHDGKKMEALREARIE